MNFKSTEQSIQHT